MPVRCRSLAAVYVALALALLASCSVPSARGGVGTQCDKNSDCAAPLVCRIGHCRRECSTSEDCLFPAQCLHDAEGLGACQTPAEESCTLASDCTAPLVCRFRQCVNECATDDDCPRGERCRESPEGRACVDDVRGRCARDGDCPSDLVCGRDGSCRAACVEDIDCRDNDFCRDVSGQCMQRESVCRDPDGDGLRSCFFVCPCPGGDYRCIALGGQDACLDVRPCASEADCAADERCGTLAGVAGSACVPAVPDPFLAALDGSVVVDGGGASTDGGTGRDGGGAALDGGTMMSVDGGRTACTPGGAGAIAFVSLAGGNASLVLNHFCGVTADGRVACWGGNLNGALGRGTASTSEPFDYVTGISDAVEVVVGEAFTCVRHATGTVSCFGRNLTGQLGNGSTTTATLPTPVVGLTDATSLAAGPNRVCATRATGRPVCWGDPQRQGVSPWLVPTEEPLLPDGATDVAVSEDATCALRMGVVTCLRANLTATPDVVGPGAMITDFLDIHAGQRFFCGLRASNALHCFGRNVSGALGNPSITAFEDWLGGSVVTPAIVPATARVALGGNHGCYMDGTSMICWGDNAQGQIDASMTTTFTMGTAVHTWPGTSRAPVGFVAASASGTCWGDGAFLECWGTLFFGEPGGRGERRDPIQIYNCAP